MNNGGDPLDLDGDGKFTVVDMAILDEEEKRRGTNDNKNSGCCIAFLAIGTAALLSIWGITHTI